MLDEHSIHFLIIEVEDASSELGSIRRRFGFNVFVTARIKVELWEDLIVEPDTDLMERSADVTAEDHLSLHRVRSAEATLEGQFTSRSDMHESGIEESDPVGREISRRDRARGTGSARMMNANRDVSSSKSATRARSLVAMSRIIGSIKSIKNGVQLVRTGLADLSGVIAPRG
jgi:hypothetical protein